MARQRFAVYASSHGHYFFEEIRHLFACGLRESGFEAVERDERKGFDRSADRHLVVAPHEFFVLGAGGTLQASPWPRGVVLYNTEQHGTHWFPLARRFFDKAEAIWDLDEGQSRRLAAEGWRSAHLPLGWADSCEYFRPRRVPDRLGVRFLDAQTRRHPGTSALARRPIDLLFIGSLTPRRERFFGAAAPKLARYRCCLQFPDASRPIRIDADSALDTDALLGLAQRAKIVLNIHRDQARYFEWHRIALHGIGQGALVISEPTSPAPPFVAGRDFVEASLAEIPDAIRYYLEKSAGRDAAQRIAEQGLRTLQTECRLSDRFPSLVETLARPRSAPATARIELSSPKTDIPTERIWSSRPKTRRPLATVAVSLYNYRRFIGGCLDSVANQTLAPIDLIVVDDASTDGSAVEALVWLKRHAGRFALASLVRHRKNAGLSQARNTAFARARSEFVFVLDADNILYPRCLGRLSDALRRSTASFAYSYLRQFDEADGIMNTKPWSRALFAKGNYIDAMALVRRTAWRRLGGYRTLPLGWEDFDFWLRIARAGGWGQLIPEILAAYRVHLTSMVHTRTNPNAMQLHGLFRTQHEIDLSAGEPSAPVPPPNGSRNGDRHARVAAALMRRAVAAAGRRAARR